MKKFLLIGSLMVIASFQIMASENMYDHLRNDIAIQAFSAEENIRNEIIGQLYQEQNFAVTEPVFNNYEQSLLVQNELEIEYVEESYQATEEVIDEDELSDDENTGYSTSGYRWVIGLSLLLRD